MSSNLVNEKCNSYSSCLTQFRKALQSKSPARLETPLDCSSALTSARGLCPLQSSAPSLDHRSARWESANWTKIPSQFLFHQGQRPLPSTQAGEPWNPAADPPRHLKRLCFWITSLCMTLSRSLHISANIFLPYSPRSLLNSLHENIFHVYFIITYEKKNLNLLD